MTTPGQRPASAPSPEIASHPTEPHHKPGSTQLWLAFRFFVVLVSPLLLIPEINDAPTFWILTPAAIAFLMATMGILQQILFIGSFLSCSKAGQGVIAGKIIRIGNGPEGTCSRSPVPMLELYTSYQRAHFLPSDAFKVPNGGLWLTLETADEAHSIVHIHVSDDDIWNSHSPNPCSVGYDPCWVTADLRRLLHKLLPRFARAPLRIHVGDDAVINSFWVPATEEKVPGGYRGELNFTDARTIATPPLESDPEGGGGMRPVGFGDIARGTVADLRRRRWKCLLTDELGLVRCALIGTPVLFGLRELVAWLG